MKTVLLRGLLCVTWISSLQAATINVPADYTSLQAALVAAAGGDEIVISTNGPFNEFIALHGEMASNVTVRAAAGFNPVIEGKAGMQFTPAGTPPAAPLTPGQLMYITHGSTWIGIKFRIDMTGLPDIQPGRYTCTVGAVQGGNLNFTNCTWEWANNPNDFNALNGPMLSLNGDVGGNTVNLDHCRWKYVNMTPVNLTGGLNDASSDTVAVHAETTFTDCTWDLSPDTSNRRRNGCGLSGGSVDYTLRFLRCNFGDVSTNNPLTEPRSGQAWINIPYCTMYIDDCKFGRGVADHLRTAIQGKFIMNRCLFRPNINGHVILNDPFYGIFQTDSFFTNCVFLVNWTVPIVAIENDTGPGGPGRGNYVFSHCTYVDLTAGAPPGRAFIATRGTSSGFIHVENCLFSSPLSANGIIRNNDMLGEPIVGTVAGTNMLLASGSYDFANDSIPVDPVLANPLLQADNIHLSAGSPAIDAGGDLGVSIDHDGNTRPIGLRPDIGAIEGAAVAALLTITRSGANVVISWTGAGTLQAAPGVTGTYTNIAGATSPYTNAITGASQFYRTTQ